MVGDNKKELKKQAKENADASLSKEIQAMLAELDIPKHAEDTQAGVKKKKKKNNRIKPKDQQKESNVTSKGMPGKPQQESKKKKDQEKRKDKTPKPDQGKKAKQPKRLQAAKEESKEVEQGMEAMDEGEDLEDGYDNFEAMDMSGKAGGKHMVFSDSDAESDMESETHGVDATADGEEIPEDTVAWYEKELPALKTTEEEKQHIRNREKIGGFKDRGERLLAKEAGEESKKTDQESQWMRQVMRQGTLSDKVAAMALAVSSNPAGNLETLSSLIAMCSKKGRREATLAMDALVDLFLNSLLPSDRPLLSFNEQIERLSSKSIPKIKDEHLLQWTIEGEIKSRYLQFVRTLETWSFDNLEHMKRSSISTIFNLLKEKPEQEQMLLMMLVNKLGDTDKKISSHVVHLLTELLRKHPNMRLVVATEVEHFIFRPKVSPRGIYYGATFLNQIVLQRLVDTDLARKLIDVYLRLFKALLHADGGLNLSSVSETDERVSKKAKKRGRPNNKKKFFKKKKNQLPAGNEVASKLRAEDAVRSKLLSAILTGVNRAFPYADTKGEEFNEHIDTLFEMVHVGTFSTSTQALMVLLHIMLSRGVLSDRFYRALYGKLIAPEVRTTSKQTMFLNVVFRALKHDPEKNRVRAFLKRLLQVAMCNTAAFAAGALVLVSAMIKQRPEFYKMISVNAAMDGEKTNGVKVQDDEDAGEEQEEIKKEKDDEESESDSDSEAEEKQGGRKGTASQESTLKILMETPEDEQEETASVTSVTEEKEEKESGEKKDDGLETDYDPAKRDPLFAGCGSNTLLWELGLMLRHYHPSVRQFARRLIESPKDLGYQGDPLRDFGSNAFLDRFVYRNPRQRDIDNLKKTAATTSAFGSHGRVARLGRKVAALPVNSAKYLLRDEKRIPADEKFFYEFFKKKAENEGKDFTSELAQKLQEERFGAKRDPFLNDDEDEFDEYANKLAQDLMKETYGEPDLDDGEEAIEFDFSDGDEEQSDSEMSDDDKGAHGGKDKKIMKEDSRLFGDDDEDSSDEEEPAFDDEMEDDGISLSSSDGDDDDVFGDLDSDDGGLDDDKEEDQVEMDTLGNVKRAKKGKKGREKNASAFADAEAFAEILESAGQDSRNKRQRDWEEREERAEFAERRKNSLKKVKGIVAKHKKFKGRK